ncbi:MAG: 30S ribosomal protein S13 [Parcubacteria group bacterium]|nr:30S ribosomal protein S13 [Parcubacteria group bacterium]
MRIAGINIPDKKQLAIGLTAVYGVGRAQAKKILGEAQVLPTAKPTELTAEQENKIRQLIEAMTVEGELRRLIGANIKRLKDIKSYRGIRHMRRLPVHGQRTKVNSRTVRGNVRKTMSSGKRKLEKK